jgi:NCS2 family nucleobase:cation symporter-2
MGALLIFTASFMIVAGIQLISSRMLDTRKTFVVGISLLFGLSVNVLPQAYAQVPAQLTPLFSSPLSVTLVVAIGLNILFRIGIAVRRSFAFVPGVDSPDKVVAFMESCGAAWGARQDVIYRGGTLLNEFFEGVANAGLAEGSVTVEVSFDEFNLDMDLWYEGTLMEFSAARPPTPDELLSDDTAVARLSAFLISRSADGVTSALHDGRCHVRFHLEH